MFQVKKFNSIVASMINWVSSATKKITDFNKGSVTRTLIEAVAMELEELYYQLLQATEEAIEEAIYRTFNFPRNPPEKATGIVQFTRVTGCDVSVAIPAGTLIGTNTEPSVLFETQSDALIPGITGIATDGGTTTLIDSTIDFVAVGITIGSQVIHVSDGGETDEYGVLTISETVKPNDTLTFNPLTGSASFSHGDTYKVVVQFAYIPVRATIPGIGGNIAGGSLTVLKSGVPNISTVGNASSFTDGQDEETDFHRKARFALYIHSLARATQGALEYAARTVEQVIAAKAVDDVRPTVLIYEVGSGWTDITQAMRNPSDAPVDLFPTTGNGNALYIGANEPFDYVNLHLDTLGVCDNPSDLEWQYYNGSAVYTDPAAWSALSAMSDGTDNKGDAPLGTTGPLTREGTLSFSIPDDWIATTIDGKLRLWIRLLVTAGGTIYSVIPTGSYCSLPPGLGYVFLYCHDGSGELSPDLQASVESAVELYRGCGIIVEVKAPNLITPTITAEIVVAANYAMDEMILKSQQAIVDYLNARVLGEDLYIAELYKLVMEINSKAILNCHITVPTDDTIITSSEVLRADLDLITITAVQVS
jgi:hypothetical protein